MRILIIGLIGLAAILILGEARARGETSGVVIMYHRFGDDRFPATSIDLETFDAHLDHLKTGDYRVVPVHDIVTARAAGRELPARAVAITIDDAYASAYRHAWPRLRAAGFPFTVFVATDMIGGGDYMSWDQLRELRDHGVTIESHGAAHAHLADLPAAAVRADLDRSKRRLARELGTAPTLLAYPYGEAGDETVAAARDRGFVAAFGQHSGALGAADPSFLLPRFALNVRFCGLDRFKLLIDSRALPVRDVVPSNPVLHDAQPPVVAFSVDPAVRDLARLTCYYAGRAVAVVQNGRRVSITLPGPVPRGRTRLNCTLAGPGGRWYWYGR